VNKKYAFESFAHAAAAVDRIAEIYDQMAGRVRDRFRRFLNGEREGSPVKDACYPELRVSAGPDALVSDSRPSWGTLPYPGHYSATLTQPHLYRSYYLAQLSRLAD
jgi:AMP nucleosidase